MMIRAGISYLRNNSPKPLTESENHFSNPPSFENSLPFSLQPIHPIKIIVKHKEKKSKEKPENKKKRPAKRSKSVIKDEFCKCASRDNKLNTSSRGRSLETSIVLKKSDRPKSAKRS